MAVLMGLPPTVGRDVFKPWPSEELAPGQHFVLSHFEKIPCRVQFKGIVEWGNLGDRYVFLTDQVMVLVKPGEKIPEKFWVKAYDDVRQMVTIEDELDNLSLELPLGKIAYLPHRFHAVLRDLRTQQDYSFSENSPKQQISTHTSVALHGVNPDRGKLTVIEQTEGQAPYAYTVIVENQEKNKNPSDGL
jgi:hypothetical protein